MFDKIMNVKKPSKLLYIKYLTKHENENIGKPERKWNEEFENLDWKRINLMPFKCTIDTKLRSFQLKFVKRIIPTNTLLYKYKITNSTLCDFCNSDTETLKHMYWECHVIQNFWSRVSSFLNQKGFQISLNFRTVCFGIQEKSEDQNLINMIILLAKYYIFKCKIEKSIPSPDPFFIYLKERKIMEFYIASAKNKVNMHNLKWDKLTFE